MEAGSITDRKLKVLMISNDPPHAGGGISVYCDRLMANMPKDIEPMHLYNDKPSAFDIPAMHREVLSLKPDHIIASSIYQAGIVAYTAGLPYTLILYGSDILRWRNRARSIIARAVFNGARYIICISNETKEEALKIGPIKSDLHVVPCGVDMPAEEYTKKDARKRLGIPRDRFVVFSLGRLIARKGFFELIDSCSKADVELYIGGSGELKEKLLEYAADKKNCHILGGISEQEKHLYMAACDVFAMTPVPVDNDMEGFGIVYLEANSHARPVIGTGYGGQKTAIRHGYNGLITGIDSSPELQMLKSDMAYAARLGRNGLKWAREHSWNRIASEIMDIIRGHEAIGRAAEAARAEREKGEATA